MKITEIIRSWRSLRDKTLETVYLSRCFYTTSTQFRSFKSQASHPACQDQPELRRIQHSSRKTEMFIGNSSPFGNRILVSYMPQKNLTLKKQTPVCNKSSLWCIFCEQKISDNSSLSCFHFCRIRVDNIIKNGLTFERISRPGPYSNSKTGRWAVPLIPPSWQCWAVPAPRSWARQHKD